MSRLMSVAFTDPDAVVNRIEWRYVEEDDLAAEQHPEDCPECRQGKHRNCTGWAIDPDTDEFTDCGCAAGGHL